MDVELCHVLKNNSLILMSVLLPFVIKTTPSLGTCPIND